MDKHTVSTVEARRTLSSLLLAVQFQGARVTITRNGRPVAELVPAVEPDLCEGNAGRVGRRAKR